MRDNDNKRQTPCLCWRQQKCACSDKLANGTDLRGAKNCLFGAEI